VHGDTTSVSSGGWQGGLPPSVATTRSASALPRNWGAVRQRLQQFQSDVTNSNVMNHAQKKGAFYVGRGSPWGNPYRVGSDFSRDEAVAMFLHDLMTMPADKRVAWLMPIAAALRDGKTLRCFCAPRLCHAMVLAGWVRGHQEFSEFWKRASHNVR